MKGHDMGKFLARGTSMEVGDGDPGGTGELFVEIGHITSIAPSASKTDADMTTFDSEGNAEHQVAQRSKTLTVEGKYDPADAGQDRLRTLAEAIGDASLANFTVTLPNGDEEAFSGSVAFSGPSGGNNDGATYSATITRSGASTMTPAV